MQAPLFVRPLTADERATLTAGLRASAAFTVRRCQMLLASAEGQPTTTIARTLRCNDQTVRNAIHDFAQRGVGALHQTGDAPSEGCLQGCIVFQRLCILGLLSLYMELPPHTERSTGRSLMARLP